MFIEREHRVIRTDNTLLVEPRSAPILSTDAYPLIFQKQPAYLTTQLPLSRQAPEIRRKYQELRDRAKFHEWCETDKKSNFDAFKEGIKEILPEKWVKFEKTNSVVFGKVDDMDALKFIVACQVSTDLSVKICHENILLPISKFKWLLSKEGKCLLWTVLDNLHSHLNGYDESNVTINDKLVAVIKILNASNLTVL